MVRLQKFLADNGIASRRKCEELIVSGRVTVNGETVTELGVKTDENADTVRLDGKIVGEKAQKLYYVALNKPDGCVTTSKDQFGRPCAVDLVKIDGVRLFAVGRLDYGTTGLLLLTNDGAFAYKMTHPKHMTEKTYIARIKGVLSAKDLHILRAGVKIDGRETSPAQVQVLSENDGFSNVKITITEGRNRQIRKMFSAVRRNVAWLKRVSIGGVELGALQPGEWRRLTAEEVAVLKT